MIIEFVRGEIVGRLEGVALLGIVGIEMNHRHSPAPFLRLLAFALVAHEVLERREQKAAELSFRPIHPLKSRALQQIGKESLHRVFRVFRSLASPPGERIQGLPVSFAKFCNRSVSDRAIGAGSQDQGPLSRGETAPGWRHEAVRARDLWRAQGKRR